MGLLVLAYMSGGSMPKTLAMAALGLFLGTIGIDQMSGFFRFQYGIIELGDGIGVVPVAVGLLGLSEVLLVAGSGAPAGIKTPRLSELLPSRKEARQSIGPTARGTVLGFLIGLVPGSAHIISSFVSYGVERRISKTPEEFGKGAVAGVAGPEAANNAAACGAFVPMLALGVPSGPDHGGHDRRPDGARRGAGAADDHRAAGAVLGLHRQHVRRQRGAAGAQPADGGLLVQLLRIPYAYLYTGIIVFCVLGVYAVNQSVVEVWIMVFSGLAGYVLRKLDFEVAPVVLGLVLAPMLEMSLRQSLAMSAESYWILWDHQIARYMLVAALLLLLLGLKPLVTRRADWRASVGVGDEAP